jgi:hypothetical protein
MLDTSKLKNLKDLNKDKQFIKRLKRMKNKNVLQEVLITV